MGNRFREREPPANATNSGTALSKSFTSINVDRIIGT